MIQAAKNCCGHSIWDLVRRLLGSHSPTPLSGARLGSVLGRGARALRLSVYGGSLRAKTNPCKTYTRVMPNVTSRVSSTQTRNVDSCFCRRTRSCVFCTYLVLGYLDPWSQAGPPPHLGAESHMNSLASNGSRFGAAGPPTCPNVMDPMLPTFCVGICGHYFGHFWRSRYLCPVTGSLSLEAGTLAFL